MKILLVNPPYNIEQYYGGLAPLGFRFPPMALMCLAAYTRQFDGYEVKGYDFQANKEDFSEVIADYSPDVVAITCHTALVFTTLILCKEIKKQLESTFIIVGGTHPTIRPNDLLAEPAVDLVVRGEGEVTFLETLKYLKYGGELKEIDGISYREDDGFTHNGERKLLKNLDDLPIPAFDLFPHDEYRCSPDLRVANKVMMLSTSRGCPFACTFCAMKETFTQTYRFRTIETIQQEIEHYVETYNADGLFIVDELFTANKKRIDAFCNMMIETGLNKKVTWWCQTRTDCINKEMLIKMKEAGCKMLSFGIESGVDRILKLIKKNTKTAEIREAIKLADSVGLDTRGSFILGLPTETRLDSLKTIMFGLTLPLKRLKYGLATPYPGTELWTQAVDEGQIRDDENWNRFTSMAGYTSHEAPYIPPGRKSKELKFLQLTANLVFFLKPKTIISLFKYYSEIGDYKALLVAAKTFVSGTFMRA